ncbi:carbohydrate porin [Vibrio ishigakensis]|nr:carbohydrate porin [Vibrio ishigakensis]
MKNTFKLSLAAILVSSAMTANAGISIVDNEEGNFSIGGNVELNFNYQDREMMDDSEFNQDGRVLIEFAGEKFTDAGYYVGVKAQPLFESTGNVALDDAYFEFGKQDSWAVRAGRYEAYDMFPVGLDVFLEYSGDTSNELYSDGSAYIYQMKEARGRGADGQIMYYQSFGNLYVELGTMLGDRSGLFSDDGMLGQKTYHGESIVSTKDSFLVRPVVAYNMGDFTVAASMETNLVNDTAVTSSGVDVGDRTGYGLTGNWATGDISVNANFAYMDAVDETNMSVGLNALYKNFGLGYIYGMNEYENKEIKGWADGDVNVSTYYASYEFTNVLAVQDFSVLLGAYYSSVDNKLDNPGSAMFEEHDDYGARIRLFYEF